MKLGDFFLMPCRITVEALTKAGNRLFWNQISGKRSQLTLPFLAAICKISTKKYLLGTELPVCCVGGPHRVQRVCFCPNVFWL